MSEIKVNSIKGVSASSAAISINNTDGTCTANITNNLSNRNKVINGAAIISQRGTTFSPTGTDQIYTLDRFQHVATSGVSWDATVTQDSSAPDGFLKSYKVTPDSTDTPTGGGNACIRYKIEGQDLQDLAYGTSSAKPLTISFYAKTGSENSGDQYTLCIFYFRSDGTGKTVTVAFTPTSTWQRFNFTFAGDTDATYGIRNSTDMGISIQWVLAAGPSDIQAAMSTWTVDGTYFRGVTGQNNFNDNTNNEFYLTGVQLEVGSVATDFEHRSFGQELALCQRYCQVLGGNRTQELLMHGTFNGAGTVTGFYEAQVQFRAKPSFSISNVAHVNCYGFNAVDAGSPTSMTLINAMSDKHWIYIDNSLSSNVGTGGLTAMVRANSTTACKFTLDAEL